MLQKVVVSELFGLIDQELNISANKITIFTAANGYGKTTLLQLIDAFYHGDLPYIASVEFNQLTFIFNQQNVCFTRLNSSQLSYVIGNNDSGQISDPYHFDSHDFSDELPASEIDEICQKLTYDSDTHIDIWGDDDYAQTCHVATVNQHPEAVDWHQQLYPDELKTLLAAIKTQFIDANRVNYAYTTNQDNYQHDQPKALSLIEMCANDLAQQFTLKLDQYHACCQKLDASFATRLIDKTTETCDLSQQSWLNQYQTLYSTIEKISSFGLLPEDISQMPSPQDLRENDKKLLALFIQDCKVKFSPYEKLMVKLQQFIDIVNANLCFKSLTIDVNLGFEVLTDNHNIIELNNLSDGEQQLIVLLYQVIILSDDNQLVLIDTPEIGLNAQWQINFKQQLLALTKTYDCQFIIASHSSHIVDDQQALQTKRCDHCGHLH